MFESFARIFGSYCVSSTPPCGLSSVDSVANCHLEESRITQEKTLERKVTGGLSEVLGRLEGS